MVDIDHRQVKFEYQGNYFAGYQFHLFLSKLLISSVINQIKVSSNCKCLIFYLQAEDGPQTEMLSCLRTISRNLRTNAWSQDPYLHLYLVRTHQYLMITLLVPTPSKCDCSHQRVAPILVKFSAQVMDKVSLTIINCVPLAVSTNYYYYTINLLHFIIVIVTTLYCDTRSTTVINGHLSYTASYLVCYSSTLQSDNRQ